MNIYQKQISVAALCIFLIVGSVLSCLAATTKTTTTTANNGVQHKTAAPTPAPTPKTLPKSIPAPTPTPMPSPSPSPSPTPEQSVSQPPAPPLSVEEAVRLAVQNNLQLKMAQQQVNVAGDKVEQAKAGYRPTISLGAGISHLNDTPDIVKLADKLSDMNNGLKNLISNLGSSFTTLGTVLGQTTTYGTPGFVAYHTGQALTANANSIETTTGPDPGLNYYTFSLSLTQPLYTGGKLTALNKQAQANEQQAKEELENAKQTLILNVKSAYYTILQAQRIEQTLREAVADMQNHLNEANFACKAGVVAKLDVVQAEAKLADLQQKLMMAQNGVALAKKAFNFFLGIKLDQEYTFVEDLKKDPFPKDMATCKELALANRPEIRSLKQKEEMARQQAVIVQSAQKPLVAFVVNAEQQDTKITNAESSLNFNLVAQYKLYDGGLVKNQVAEAQENLKTVQTAEDLLAQGVMLEVEQSYRNLQNALETIQVAIKSQAYSEETLHMAQVSYKAGLCTSLERIDAEVGLTQARNNYTQALASYNIALARLEKAIGKNKEELQ